jgi:hypothetical protein
MIIHVNAVRFEECSQKPAEFLRAGNAASVSFTEPAKPVNGYYSIVEMVADERGNRDSQVGQGKRQPASENSGVIKLPPALKSTIALFNS